MAESVRMSPKGKRSAGERFVAAVRRDKYLIAMVIPAVALLNKSDLPAATDAEALIELLRETVGRDKATEQDSKLASVKPIAISAKTGEGLETLEERITSMFFAERIAADDECVITSERHRQALLVAESSLAKVQESMAAGMPEDFYTIDLTAAYETLGTILGEQPDEDVINMIFSEFCLGK